MNCRICGQPMERITQPGYASASIPDRDLVTCWNEPHCPLAGQTLDAKTYPTKDLSPYLVRKAQVTA